MDGINDGINNETMDCTNQQSTAERMVCCEVIFDRGRRACIKPAAGCSCFCAARAIDGTFLLFEGAMRRTWVKSGVCILAFCAWTLASCAWWSLRPSYFDDHVPVVAESTPAQLTPLSYTAFRTQLQRAVAQEPALGRPDDTLRGGEFGERAKEGEEEATGAPAVAPVAAATGQCSGRRPFHTLLPAQANVFNQWQARIMYYHWKKQAAAGGPCTDMTGFTRLCASKDGLPDGVEKVVPSVFVKQLTKEALKKSGHYKLLNRPHSIVEFLSSPELLGEREASEGWRARRGWCVTASGRSGTQQWRVAAGGQAGARACVCVVVVVVVATTAHFERENAARLRPQRASRRSTSCWPIPTCCSCSRCPTSPRPPRRPRTIMDTCTRRPATSKWSTCAPAGRLSCAGRENLNRHSTAIQPPLNRRSTATHPPVKRHPTATQPPCNRHATAMQPPCNPPPQLCWKGGSWSALQPVGGAPLIIALSDLKKAAGRWLECTTILREAPQTLVADAAVQPWVLDMWGYAIAAASAGVRHKMVPSLITEPIAVDRQAVDWRKQSYMFHYTYPLNYMFDGRPLRRPDIRVDNFAATLTKVKEALAARALPAVRALKRRIAPAFGHRTATGRTWSPKSLGKPCMARTS